MKKILSVAWILVQSVFIIYILNLTYDSDMQKIYALLLLILITLNHASRLIIVSIRASVFIIKEDLLKIKEAGEIAGKYERDNFEQDLEELKSNGITGIETAGVIIPAVICFIYLIL